MMDFILKKYIKNPYNKNVENKEELEELFIKDEFNLIIEKINKKFIECNWKLFNINIYKCELNEYKGNTKGVIFPDCKIFINIEKYSLESEEEKIKYLNSIEVKNIENIIRENGDDNMEINLINIIPFNKNNFSSSIFSNNIYIYIYI